MKKLYGILTFLSFLLTSGMAQAQYYGGSNGGLRNVAIRMKVMEAGADSPLSYASVYIIPQGDTTIVEFGLTDKEGLLEFKDVPSGRYELHIEMMGFKPYKEEHFFKKWREDLGEIQLEPSKEYLHSATVTAAANPVRIMKDTIEFNASSFRVGRNDMLIDLLKKMPGIEIENGEVKLNGEKIDRITVGGKTFFFNDNSAALSNLPAHIVDKIQVIDQDKEKAQFTGVSRQDDREKVMDVLLKKEFKKGWFGNVKAGGGSTVIPETQQEMIDNRGVLYNANATISRYNEKDQLVLIGNAFNALGGGSSRAMMMARHQGQASASGGDYASMNGLPTAATAGINYNTDRIPLMETSASLSFKNSTRDGKKKSFRTAFQQEGPDLETQSGYRGTGHENAVDLSLEIKSKKKQDFYLEFLPSIGYSRNHAAISNTAVTRDGHEELNSNLTVSTSDFSNLAHGLHLTGGLKNLGKKERSVMLSGGYSMSSSLGDKWEKTTLTGKNPLEKDLTYDDDSHDLNLNASLSYVEPLSDHLHLQTAVGASYYRSEQDKEAFNPDRSRNDYYSSLSRNTFHNESASLILQYQKHTATLQAGIYGQLICNELYSQSLGKEQDSGKDDWRFNWSPFLYMGYQKGHQNLYLYYAGSAYQVSSRLIVPSIDFSDPLQIFTGNIYLKPEVNHSLMGSYSMNSTKTFTFVKAHLNTGLKLNPIVNAIWFDDAGVRYMVPVNAQKPQGNVGLWVTLNQPFGPERHFSLSVDASCDYSRNMSYQAKTRLPGMDIELFDYEDFMKGFWGGPAGDRFYGEDSGFAESATQSIGWHARLGLKYTNDWIDFSIGGKVGNNISRYSLDRSANTSIWNCRLNGNLLLQPGKDWEIGTDLAYVFYRGYTQGYGAPELQWDLRLSKSVKAFTFSLSCHDLLNQTRNLQHTVSNEYVEDVYSNVIGRHLMFSVAFNFGKRNAKNNNTARAAMWKM